MPQNEHQAKFVPLTVAEIGLLISALDSHEYWQLGDVLPRNNGAVWLPGDAVDVVDRFWEGRTPTDEEAEAIEAVLECRELANRLLAETRSE